MAPKKQTGKKSSAPAKPSQKTEGDYIVFGDEDKGKKKRNHDQTPPPPRPDTKKIIGGQSWTGKLPVNLLSELCQREKWNKPDYSMRQVPDQTPEKNYRSHVTLSKTDPKTRETTTVPPFDLPSSHLHLGDQPTALEARHFAATYALFRVASMKNIHMTLPPTYRDLWKGPFQELKQADVKEQRGWKYDADPFAADAKRKEIHVAMEKRRVEQETKRNEKETTAGTTLPVLEGSEARKWARAPAVELGDDLRTQLESVVRVHTVWNLQRTHLPRVESQSLLAELSKVGFRPSHVSEAIEHCGSRQEVLDWLLIHVPEDDLPPWALKSGYKAGVSLASGDGTKDAKVQRLSQAGYSTDLCLQALRDNDYDEGVAWEALQAALVPPPVAVTYLPAEQEPDQGWESEMEALAAVYAERFGKADPVTCTVSIDSPAVGRIRLRFRKPGAKYPRGAVPNIAIEAAAALPAYIKLGTTKQALNYAWSSLLGEQMIFALVDWIESSLPGVMQDPGKLMDLEVSAASLNLSQLSFKPPTKAIAGMQHTSQYGRSARRDKRTGVELKQNWTMRQETAAQKKMNAARESLPAWSKQEEIVTTIESSQVTIITGDTGSGKSTQSVQFVLDEAIDRGRGAEVNILCTQPRRVAALGLSDRVAAERCSTEGDEVGFIIRGDSRVSANTKITFLTTGVLLRRLQLAPTLKQGLAGVSHVFVDEVHERSLDTDFLLALLKDVLPKMPSLKIICMSATVDADVFSSYFRQVSTVGRAHIEGRTFPVLDYFLDDVLHMTGNTTMTEDGEQDIGKAIQSLGRGINYDLIASLVEEIDRDLGAGNGGILIFLPGTIEIQRCLRALANIPRIHALPLHASLLPSEQKRVFPPAPRGLRKVIAATNVAETSITIEDIVAVIDSGRVKETSYDSISRMVRLQEVWASQASCRQRRGRAGRVRAGNCYKLFTRNVETSMRPHSEPEMRRVPLEQLCLSVKASSPQSDVVDFLSRVLSPPDASAVSTALNTLHRMGALDNGLLTGLGSSMSMIPADLRCAKLIIFGTLYCALEPCLTIAAILSVRSPFFSPPDKRDEASAARNRYSTDDGDLLLDMSAFNDWKANNGSRAWCEMNFLSMQTLRDIDSTRQQLLDSLKEAAFVPMTYRTPLQTSQATNNHNDKSLNAHSKNPNLLRALIAGALSPQIAEIKLPEKKYIASMSGAKELDPEARTIRYYVEAATTPTTVTNTGTGTGTGTATPPTNPNPNTPTPTPTPTQSPTNRVFIHPSSPLFTLQTPTRSAQYLSYFTLLSTSKSFVRDLTPLNAYSLLLFGGRIEVDVTSGGIVVDGWLRLRGWARIGVLVSRLRGVVDGVVRGRIERVGGGGGGGGGADGDENDEEERRREEEKVLALVRRLVEMNGQDR